MSMRFIERIVSEKARRTACWRKENYATEDRSVVGIKSAIGGFVVEEMFKEIYSDADHVNLLSHDFEWRGDHTEVKGTATKYVPPKSWYHVHILETELPHIHPEAKIVFGFVSTDLQTVWLVGWLMLRQFKQRCRHYSVPKPQMPIQQPCYDLEVRLLEELQYP